VNPYVLGGAVVALVLAAAGGFKFGSDFAKGQAAREEVLIKKAGDAAAERAAIEIGRIDVRISPIRERVEREIVKLPPTPEECNAPKAIVDAINDARKAP